MQIPHHALAVLGTTMVMTAACAVERIDEILTEHGVTYAASSSGDAGASDSSTGERPDTSTAGDASDDGLGFTSSGEALSDGGTGDAGSSEGSSGSSSGGAWEPVCGDGIVDEGETCDDGNDTPDDGCRACASDSIVFVSSEVYQGYALGGLVGADQRCRTLAANAGLARPETFRAWLSTPARAAGERLLHSRGRYVLVNGLVVAEDWNALTSGTLDNPIVVDEWSQTQDEGVWTGTLANGAVAQGSEFCGEWADDTGIQFGGAGLSANTDGLWTYWDDVVCGTELPIYCFEQ